MIEMPADSADLRIIDHDQLDAMQIQGWKVIGLINESDVIDIVEETPCPGPSGENTPCQHSIYPGSYCSIPRLANKQVAVTKVKAVVSRTLDEALHDAIMTREERDRQLAQLRLDFESLDRKWKDLHSKHDELKADHLRISAELDEKTGEARVLAMAKIKLDALNGEVREENKILRGHIHSYSMAETLGAIELAGSGEYMSPIAFVFLLDSLEPVTIKVEQYSELLDELRSKRIIETKTSARGTQTVRVNNFEHFMDVLRNLDAVNRLEGQTANELEQPF